MRLFLESLHLAWRRRRRRWLLFWATGNVCVILAVGLILGTQGWVWAYLALAINLVLAVDMAIALYLDGQREAADARTRQVIQDFVVLDTAYSALREQHARQVETILGFELIKRRFEAPVTGEESP